MEVAEGWRRNANRQRALLEKFSQNAERMQELNEDLLRQTTQGRQDSVLFRSTPIENREEEYPIAFAPNVAQDLYPVRGKKGRVSI